MALTPSNMMPLGTRAPDFTLPDTVSGAQKTLSGLKSETATVIMFICNHCPFVRHVRHELLNISREYQPKGISFIAISANDAAEYPDDSPENMKRTAQELQFSFPYLYDASQDVARSYQAACTPDLYVFDRDLACVYRGQLDDSRPGNNIPVTGHDLRQALDDVLAGKPVNQVQKPSTGCNIKWITQG